MLSQGLEGTRVVLTKGIPEEGKVVGEGWRTGPGTGTVARTSGYAGERVAARKLIESRAHRCGSGDHIIEF